MIFIVEKALAVLFCGAAGFALLAIGLETKVLINQIAVLAMAAIAIVGPVIPLVQLYLRSLKGHNQPNRILAMIEFEKEAFGAKIKESEPDRSQSILSPILILIAGILLSSAAYLFSQQTGTKLYLFYFIGLMLVAGGYRKLSYNLKVQTLSHDSKR